MTAQRFVDYHCSLAAQLAARLSTEGELSWIDQLADEADNLRAALRTALTLGQGDAGASLCFARHERDRCLTSGECHHSGHDVASSDLAW